MTDEPCRYDPDWVSRYYDESGETEWKRLVQTPADEVSLHIHTELLRENLRPGMKVLEVGAASGRFTQVLAALGCRITVVDLSAGQLDLNRVKAEAFNFESAVEGRHRLDMCDMACFDAGSFDAVVCYGGPLSYVFEQADRGVAECCRVLKPDGVFACSVMSLWGSIHRFLPDVIQLSPEQNRVIIETGDLTPLTLPENKHWCHMFRSTELRTLLEGHRLTILEMSASSFLSSTWNEELVACRRDPVQWNALLKQEKEACRQTGCLDTGTHMIAVCRKEE